MTGAGETGLGVEFNVCSSATAVMVARSPTFMVRRLGETATEYVTLVGGCVLLVTEEPQLANNPASPMRPRVYNRFMQRTYRIVIQAGPPPALTEVGFCALIEPVFWFIWYWKILPVLPCVPASIMYRALFALETVTNEGVVQATGFTVYPQSNGEAVETGTPLMVVLEPRTSVSSPCAPEVEAIWKTETLWVPALATKRKRLSCEVAPATGLVG
jgi:hypothetical protein